MKLNIQGNSTTSKCSWKEREVTQRKKEAHNTKRAQINEIENRNVAEVWESKINDFAVISHTLNPLRDQQRVTHMKIKWSP